VVNRRKVSSGGSAGWKAGAVVAGGSLVGYDEKGNQADDRSSTDVVKVSYDQPSPVGPVTLRRTC
jgi:hypothetical protein